MKHNKYQILLVDDDISIINSLTKTLNNARQYMGLRAGLKEYDYEISGFAIHYKDTEGIIKRCTQQNAYNEDYKQYTKIYKIEVMPNDSQSIVEEFSVEMDISGIDYAVVRNKSGEYIKSPDSNIKISQKKYEVIISQNATEALEVMNKQKTLFGLGKHKVDCIILDIKMPGKDGLSFLNEWRQKEKLNIVPVILLSAFEDEEKWARATDVSEGVVSAYLKKPIKKDELLRALDRIVDKKETEIMSKETREAGYSTRQKFRSEKHNKA